MSIEKVHVFRELTRIRRGNLLTIVTCAVILYVIILALYVTSDTNMRRYPQKIYKTKNNNKDDNNNNLISKTLLDPQRSSPGSSQTKVKVKATDNSSTKNDNLAPWASQQPKLSEPIGPVTKLNGYNLIYGHGKPLTDKKHPQYSPAFARFTKPVHLLDWVPSPDSASYFQPIGDTEGWLYSAYFPDCAPPIVKLIGIGRRDGNVLGHVFCHVSDDQGKTETLPGRFFGLKDNHGLNYTAATVECYLENRKIFPAYVSVTKYEQSAPTNHIRVQYAGTERRNFSMCFSPLQSVYNATFQLVQSIELNSMLGAEHFYFYNFSTSSATDEILEQYEKDGLVTILPWPLPHLETWYYAQVAAINDCIYRNRMTSRYVVIVDTDEFIISNKHVTWYELFEDIHQSNNATLNMDELRSTQTDRKYVTLDDDNDDNDDDDGGEEISDDKNNDSVATKVERRKDRKFGSYMFKNAFFIDKPLTSDENRKLEKNSFRLTSKQSKFFKSFFSGPVMSLKRDDRFSEFNEKTKLVVRPDTVVSHAIHRTVHHVQGYRTAYVNPEVAFMHHYRSNALKKMNTFDMSALRYKDALYQRLRQRLKQFPSIFPPELLE